MRFKNSYHAPSGDPQYWFSVNIEELEILKGLVAVAYRMAPKPDESRNAADNHRYQRLKTMNKGLVRGITLAKAKSTTRGEDA